MERQDRRTGLVLTARHVIAAALAGLVALVAAIVVLSDDPIGLLTYGVFALAAWTLLALVLTACALAAAVWYERPPRRERDRRARERRIQAVPIAVLPYDFDDESAA